ncbi:MAG: hypothetical protein WKG00_22600 [Polyangiaceae bacterium]
MRWQYVGGLTAVLVVALHGCSADSEDGGSGSAGSGAAGTSGSGDPSQQASSVGPSSGSGAAPSDGNDTFATAEPIALDGSHAAEISPTGDVDYYSFAADAGSIVYFNLDAQDLDGAGFDAKHLDLVLTVYDAAEVQVAENDTPVPRYSADPEMYFVVPATGTYVLRVAECWQWAEDPEAQCAAPEAKELTAYELLAITVDPARFESIVGETEPNDEAATADEIEYAKGDAGTYYYSDIIGDFASATDIDVYAFSLPTDTPVTEGRPVAHFWPMAWGPSGNGSTTSPGRMYLVDPLDPTVRFAEVDAALGQRLQVPVDLGRAFQLWVEHQGEASGANDFYVARHYGAGSNPVESSDASNGEWSGAEPLSLSDNGDGTFSFFIDGDITVAGVDVDHFSIEAAPAPDLTRVSVACSAQRRGSGLRELTFQLLDAEGVALPGATHTEGPDEDAQLPDVAIPGGARSLLLRVSAESQEANVTSTFYRCGVHLGM